MSCKDSCGYPIKPAPFAPADPGPCGPCGPRPGHRPPPPPPCPPSQYIGMRYVPKFADPLEWDGAKAYENLIIVTYNNESYTSRCPVPPGIDITNERYWAKTGAYNAQVEQLKGSVEDLSSQVTGFAEDNKEMREKIAGFEKDNAAMKNTVAANNARVDALAERMNTAETEIDGLQATTAQHTKDLADLHAKDEDLQRQITSNDNDIAALQAKDVEQDSRLDGIDTKLKSHDATLAQNTADIAKNTKNIQDNAAAIAANAHELADHAEELADHEARLTAQHKEITDNHTAIERNTSDIASLRADLTEDEAKIEANRDAIAHIQEKDVQQDGRLDALEKRATNAEGRLDGLDTKTDATNTALTAEVDRAKAAELAQGKLIAKNAAELADHATELADHEERITALEGDNTTNKQEIADIKAKNTEQDTAISGNTDAIAHINDSLTGYVKTETYTAGQAQQDEATAAVKTTADKAAADIGDWDTAHPGQTVAECATSQENELTEHAGQIATLENDKADKSEIPDVSGFVTTETYTAGQAQQKKEYSNALPNGNLLDFPSFSCVHYATHGSSYFDLPVPIVGATVAYINSLTPILADNTYLSWHTDHPDAGGEAVFINLTNGQLERYQLNTTVEGTVHGMSRANLPSGVVHPAETRPLRIHVTTNIPAGIPLYFLGLHLTDGDASFYGTPCWSKR